MARYVLEKAESQQNSVSGSPHTEVTPSGEKSSPEMSAEDRNKYVQAILAKYVPQEDHSQESNSIMQDKEKKTKVKETMACRERAAPCSNKDAAAAETADIQDEAKSSVEDIINKYCERNEDSLAGSRH